MRDRTVGGGARVPRAAALGLALGAILAGAGPAEAQAGRFFPAVEPFEYPAASPRANAFVGRMLDVSRGDSRFGAGREAEAGVAEDFPILALRRGERPLALGFGVGVTGRFNLADAKSSHISADWFVGFNMAVPLGAWRVTGQVYHESSHLGDEYAETFGATRSDWTREVATLWLARTAGPWRVSGALSYVLIDELRLERPGAALGIDYRGRRLNLLGLPAHPVAAVFFDAQAATDWRISSSARLGLGFPGERAGREFGLSLVAHDGLSTQRQFFRAESRYWGLELRFDL